VEGKESGKGRKRESQPRESLRPKKGERPRNLGEGDPGDARENGRKMARGGGDCSLDPEGGQAKKVEKKAGPASARVDAGVDVGQGKEEMERGEGQREP